MDRGAWLAAVHWVAKSQTRLSDYIAVAYFITLASTGPRTILGTQDVCDEHRLNE